MSWPYFLETKFGPDIAFGNSYGSFVFSTDEQASSKFTYPISLDKSCKLYSATNGYNGRVLVPRDRRFQFYESKRFGANSTTSYIRNALYIPKALAMEYEKESRLSYNSNRGFDPTIVNLMDVGDIQHQDNTFDSLDFPNLGAIAYVTGAERTNVALSVLRSADKDIHYMADIARNDMKASITIPDLSPAYVYHTKQPIFQLNLLNQKINEIYPSTVCLVRTSSTVNVLKTSYQCEEIEEGSVLQRPILNPLYSISLNQSLDLTAPFEVVSHVSLHPNLPQIAALKSRGTLSLYSRSEEDGRNAISSFSETSLPFFRWGSSHSSWGRVFWSDDNTLLIANRYAIKTFDTREHRYSINENFIGNENTSSFTKSVFLSDVCSSPDNSHDFFAVADNKLLWIDTRYPKRPVLSIRHFFPSEDPSVKIDPVYNKESGQTTVTLTSQLSSLATIYQIGKDSMNLPVLKNDPFVYHLHPEYSTQTLKTVILPKNNRLHNEKYLGDTFMTYSSFQQSRDFGLVQHILTSDPKLSIDLSETYNPTIKSGGEHIQYHKTLLQVTRGLPNENDQDGDQNNMDVRDCRPLTRLISDFENDINPPRYGALERSLDYITQRIKVLRKKHERGVYSLLQILESKCKFGDPSFDITRLLKTLKSLSKKRSLIKSRIYKIKNMLFNSEIKSIEEMHNYLEKIWIDPLKGHAISKKLFKATNGKLKKRRGYSSHELENSSNKKSRYSFPVKRTNSKPLYVSTFPVDGKMVRKAKIPNYKLRNHINSRSVDYKHPPYYYNHDFVSIRHRILNQITRDIALSHVTLSIKKNGKADKFVDEDLGELRKYSSSLDRIRISEETKQVLSIWKIKENPITQQDHQNSIKTSSQQRPRTRSGKSGRKQSITPRVALQSPSLGRSQSQGFSQSQSQSQFPAASHTSSLQRKKKKRKTNEGFF